MPEERPSSSLDQLDAKLKAAREHREAAGRRKGGGSGAGSGSGLGFAFRIGVELVSAVAVGVAIGLLLDYWLGTKPWLMVVFFILGSAAGFLNVYRTMRGYGYAAGYREKAGEKNGKGSE